MLEEDNPGEHREGRPRFRTILHSFFQKIKLSTCSTCRNTSTTATRKRHLKLTLLHSRALRGLSGEPFSKKDFFLLISFCMNIELGIIDLLATSHFFQHERQTGKSF